MAQAFGGSSSVVCGGRGNALCVSAALFFLGRQERSAKLDTGLLHSVAIVVQKVLTGSLGWVTLLPALRCAGLLSVDSNKMAPCGSFRTPSSTAMSMILSLHLPFETGVALNYTQGYEVCLVPVMFQRSRTFIVRHDDFFPKV